MLTKEQAIETAEKYLKKNHPIFNKTFFSLESALEGAKYKGEGKNEWELFDYLLNWVEFVDNTEKHEERNTIKLKINAKTGHVYFVDIKHHNPPNKAISKDTIKKIQDAKNKLLDFLVLEAKSRKVKMTKNIPFPLSIEEHPIYQKAFFFQNDFGKFYVPVNYIYISDFVFNPIENEKSRILTDEEATEIVKKFLKKNYFNFTKRNFEIRSWKSEDDNLIHFDLTERPGKGEVSVFENYIRTMVDKRKHSIEYYHATDLWIRRTKLTKITKEQAIKIFTKRFLKAQSPEARLHEKLDVQTQKTTTVWYIYDEHNSDKIEDKFCFGTYLEIDADSGKIVKVGGFECR